jgi:hypothetical protein
LPRSELVLSRYPHTGSAACQIKRVDVGEFAACLGRLWTPCRRRSSDTYAQHGNAMERIKFEGAVSAWRIDGPLFGW